MATSQASGTTSGTSMAQLLAATCKDCLVVSLGLVKRHAWLACGQMPESSCPACLWAWLSAVALVYSLIQEQQVKVQDFTQTAQAAQNIARLATLALNIDIFVNKRTVPGLEGLEGPQDLAVTLDDMMAKINEFTALHSGSYLGFHGRSQLPEEFGIRCGRWTAATAPSSTIPCRCLPPRPESWGCGTQEQALWVWQRWPQRAQDVSVSREPWSSWGPVQFLLRQQPVLSLLQHHGRPDTDSDCRLQQGQQRAAPDHGDGGRGAVPGCVCVPMGAAVPGERPALLPVLQLSAGAARLGTGCSGTGWGNTRGCKAGGGVEVSQESGGGGVAPGPLVSGMSMTRTQMWDNSGDSKEGRWLGGEAGQVLRRLMFWRPPQVLPTLSGSKRTLHTSNKQLQRTAMTYYMGLLRQEYHAMLYGAQASGQS
ncbi:hypothetical protein HaLaN_17233 [Haematococcus lacustris]|uniref:Uncharacterized protein n=1 Tax=Haematococcus lacustris TaxID=44745 RepID=A0A699ZN33_HAELA|nr:hypothetical protein HaLaN_17233 [Haematococcus lacustris]